MIKETALDVLMYLFENYADEEFSSLQDQDGLRAELAGAGFPEEEIEHAFAWLDGLAERRAQVLDGGQAGTLRVFAPAETRRLDVASRGFLLYLEQLGILSPQARELVLDRVMALDEEIDIVRLKWIVLLVLFNQPGAEDAFAHMEDLVYYEGDFLH